MREIKFRGKPIEGLMEVRMPFVYGGYVKRDEKKVYIVQYDSEISYIDFTKVDPETVGQYTNLKDKNGKEIYEGDILKVKSDGETINLYVKYDIDMGEYLLIKEGEWEDSLYGCMCFYEVEVVGNIYENKDLLKQND
jgi:uncharacterized phage protein (TIGR01671 family)|nr:MAG TPA_asm: YopX protein [Caudoviricetes sp.]